MMDYICCILGSFMMAFLLGSSFIHNLKKERKIGLSKKKLRSEALKRSANGKPRSDDTDPGGVDVIIVGAGVAGSALAYALGKDGRRVHVIERDLTQPDRMVGELLQPGGYLKLIELDLQDCVSGIDAQEVLGIVFYKDGRSVKLPFPLQNFPSNVCGRSFHNGCLIQNMRKKAASLPNVRFEEGTVTSLVTEKGIIKGVRYKTKAGQESTAYAHLTIASDGGFSNLRRSLCSSKVEITSRFIGFLIENCDLPHPNYGHVFLGDTPILFYSIATGEVRCMVNITGEKIPSISNGEMANYLKTEVAPQVPPELRDAFISTIDKGNLRSAINKSMPASPCPTPGGFLIGDALNMRHPFTGGGMTVAFSDVVVLRDLLRSLNDLSDPVAVCKYLESFYILRKPMACSINSVAGLLSKIFFAKDDPIMKEMGYVCFDYMGLGGIFGGGLMSILSGLFPRPLNVVLHIVALAVFAVGRSLLPCPSPKRLWAAARLLLVCGLFAQSLLILHTGYSSCGASSVAFPVLKAEGIRKTFFPWTLAAYYRVPPAY
ncbi:hypothetical protein Tsubulata_020468 [Turnera subulata]|uniref:Squalene monooxygenase n=1 Tax=Turnera subulata TaxID=218843 RepID=A0A9Q0GH96_9ROSI|nr:hypothetical protein Tsubulata_020468 [Turnera subulata]